MAASSSEVIFVINQKKISCKRTVLLKYEYFITLLAGSFKEASQNEITLSGESLSFETFQMVIQFIKDEPVAIDINNVASLLAAADYFTIQSLKDRCIKVIQTLSEDSKRKHDFRSSYMDVHQQMIMKAMLFKKHVELLDITIKIIPTLYKTTLEIILNTLDSVGQSFSTYKSADEPFIHYLNEAIIGNYFSAFSCLLEIQNQERKSGRGYKTYHFDLNQIVTDDRRLLDIAIQYRRHGMLELLLKQNIDIEYPFHEEKKVVPYYDEDDHYYAEEPEEDTRTVYSPLSYTAYLNDLDAMKLLANCYIKNTHHSHYHTSLKTNSLHFAVQHENIDMVKLLVKIKKEEINEGEISPYQIAYEAGNEQIMNILVSNGAQKKLTKTNVPTQLETTVNTNNIATITAFIKEKPFAKNRQGQNILHYFGLRKVDEKCFASLKDQTVFQKLCVQDQSGNLPIHYAMSSGDWNVTIFLLNKGALDNFSYTNDYLNKKGEVPFDCACQKGMKDFVIKVIKYLTNNRPHQGNKLATDLLFWAAKEEYYDIVKYLVEEKKADVNILSSKKDSFLHWTASKGRLEATKFLVKHGALVNHQNQEKRTPLHEAALRGEDKVIQCLLSSNANPSFWDKDGKTALQLAQQQLKNIESNAENRYRNTIEQLEQAECKMQ